jgi:hypothetical protein
MPDRPELMAIGDSIYNGTALASPPTASWRDCRRPPRSPAPSAGRSRSRPYPFDVLFNLEALFRADSFDLNTLKASVVANAEGWLARERWADEECFDNIAIAQTTIADQARLTYLNNVDEIAPLLDKVRRGSGLDFGALMGLYEAVNTSFVLIPRPRPASRWADKTPLEIVAERPAQAAADRHRNQRRPLDGVPRRPSRPSSIRPRSPPPCTTSACGWPG